MQQPLIQVPTTIAGALSTEWPSFYFLRHGQTDANLRDIMCGGGWDLELNAAGMSQAFNVAQGPLLRLFDVKTICTSPMRRARQTTNIIKAVLKLDVVVIEDLREIMVGGWERQPWRGVPDPFSYADGPPGGEALAEFEKRVERGIGQALLQPGPVLVVAHGGVWYALAKRLGIKHGAIANCVLTRVFRDRLSGSWCAQSAR